MLNLISTSCPTGPYKSEACLAFLNVRYQEFLWVLLISLLIGFIVSAIILFLCKHNVWSKKLLKKGFIVSAIIFILLALSLIYLEITTVYKTTNVQTEDCRKVLSNSTTTPIYTNSDELIMKHFKLLVPTCGSVSIDGTGIAVTHYGSFSPSGFEGGRMPNMEILENGIPYDGKKDGRYIIWPGGSNEDGIFMYLIDNENSD